APGFSALQSRLQTAKNGRPRLFVYENALRERDELRDEAHQPVCFENEINEYVWSKSKDGQPFKEVQIKLNNHSMYAARYAVMYMDNGFGSIERIDASIVNELYSYKG